MYLSESTNKSIAQKKCLTYLRLSVVSAKRGWGWGGDKELQDPDEMSAYYSVVL